MKISNELRERIREGIAAHKKAQEAAFDRYREGIECSRPAECWCPLCDPQSYGGVGPDLTSPLIDVVYDCPGCSVKMGQIRVNHGGSLHCPRCNHKLE